MKINRQTLSNASEKGILSEEQAHKLWDFLNKESEDESSLNFTHLFYYLGGGVAIAAMSLFITLGWEKLGGFGILLTTILYMLIGIMVTQYLFKRRQMVLVGILASFVVALTPLAIYGFQKTMGWWPEQYRYQDYHFVVQGLWIMMELGTLVVGAILFYLYRRPFLVLPIAITLWYISMDLTLLLFSDLKNPWEYRKYVSIVVGICMLLFAFGVDIRTKSKLDYAFYLYLFGLLAFWGGLTSLNSNNEWGKFMYFILNLLLIFLGTLLARRAFLVFGGLGSFLYLGHLAYDIFKDSLLFPFILSLLGFGIIYIGILWSKHGKTMSQKLRLHLPIGLRRLLERRH